MKLISDWHLGNIINCKYFHFLHIKSDQTKREDRSRFEAITRNRITRKLCSVSLWKKGKKNWSKGSLKITKVQIFPHSQPRFFLVNKTKIQNYPFKRSILLIVIRLRCGRTNFTRRGNGGCIDKQGSTERWLRTFDRCLPLLQPIVANISEGDRGCLRNNWRVVILSSK